MLLIVQSLWNESITKKLVEGAQKVCAEKNFDCTLVQVPGALEIPLAIKWEWAKAQRDQLPLEGVIGCGVIIKGETYHFEIVANESARALTALGLELRLPIGNGVLAVYSIEQALERAGGRFGNKGEEAAHAVIHMAALKEKKDY